MDLSIYSFDNTDGEPTDFYLSKPKQSRRQSNRRKNIVVQPKHDNTKPLYQVNKKVSDNIKKGKKGQVVVVTDDGWETVEHKKVMRK